jgi:hypothetical protein
MAGHLAKAGAEAGQVLKEFRVAEAELANLKPGEVIAATIFQAARRLTSPEPRRAKGFAGVIKRHHFSSNRASHGNSRIAQQTWLDRHEPGSGPRFPGQAHGRPHGRCDAHLRRTWSLSASMKSASCCSSRVPFRAAAGTDVQSGPSGGSRLRGARWNSN